jgi:hypothetical protein
VAYQDLRVKDSITFQAVTGDPRQIAGLYFYKQLDCLVDLAHRVSQDLFMRPQFYINLGEVPKKKDAPRDAPPKLVRQALAELHGRFGYNELFPSNAQRDEIFRPIFGSGGAYSRSEEGDFPRLRDGVTDAATAYAERVYKTGEDMLRERFVAAIRVFGQYLKGLQGDSVKWSRENVLSYLTEDFAYAVLRRNRVAAIFGIDTAPGPDWPYTEDANGDKLVEAISRQLRPVDAADDHIVTREAILNSQRAALRGAEAIAMIIDFSEPAADIGDINNLIGRCYSWAAALLSLKAHLSTGETGLRVYPGTGARTAETR